MAQDDILSALLLPPAEHRRADAAVEALQREGGLGESWLATRCTAMAFWAMVVVVVLTADSLGRAFNLWPDEPCDGLSTALMFGPIIIAAVWLAFHVLGHLIKRRRGGGHAGEPAVIVLFDDLAACGFAGIWVGLALLIFNPRSFLYLMIPVGFAVGLAIFLCISAALRACMRGRSPPRVTLEAAAASSKSAAPAGSMPV